jgi:hypothetical protein
VCFLPLVFIVIEPGLVKLPFTCDVKAKKDNDCNNRNREVRCCGRRRVQKRKDAQKERNQYCAHQKQERESRRGEGMWRAKKNTARSLVTSVKDERGEGWMVLGQTEEGS